MELTQEGFGGSEHVEPTLSAENTDPSQETATLIGSDQTLSSTTNYISPVLGGAVHGPIILLVHDAVIIRSTTITNR